MTFCLSSEVFKHVFPVGNTPESYFKPCNVSKLRHKFTWQSDEGEAESRGRVSSVTRIPAECVSRSAGVNVSDIQEHVLPQNYHQETATPHWTKHQLPLNPPPCEGKKKTHRKLTTTHPYPLDFHLVLALFSVPYVQQRKREWEIFSRLIPCLNLITLALCLADVHVWIPVRHDGATVAQQQSQRTGLWGSDSV